MTTFKHPLFTTKIVVLGLLVWVALPSGLLSRPKNFVHASKIEFQEQDAAKPERQEPRGITPEAATTASSENQSDAGGASIACREFSFSNGSSQGFTVEPVIGQPLWHLANGNCRADLPGHSVPFTFYYGQDSTCNFETGTRNASNLISPLISLAGLSAPFTLEFNYLLFVEFGPSFDQAFVDLSTDGGSSWTTVITKDSLVDDNSWHNIAADVTSAVGSATSIRLRFRFDAIDAILNQSTGWHVDDVRVCGTRLFFDKCLQDETSNASLQFDSTTGEYLYTDCQGGAIRGTGMVTQRGCTLTLTHTESDRRVQASFDTCANRGSASIQAFSLGGTYTITDRNTTNNTCACP